LLQGLPSSFFLSSVPLRCLSDLPWRDQQYPQLPLDTRPPLPSSPPQRLFFLLSAQLRWPLVHEGCRLRTLPRAYRFSSIPRLPVASTRIFVSLPSPSRRTSASRVFAGAPPNFCFLLFRLSSTTFFFFCPPLLLVVVPSRTCCSNSVASLSFLFSRVSFLYSPCGRRHPFYKALKQGSSAPQCLSSFFFSQAYRPSFFFFHRKGTKTPFLLPFFF